MFKTILIILVVISGMSHELIVPSIGVVQFLFFCALDRTRL